MPNHFYSAYYVNPMPTEAIQTTPALLSEICNTAETSQQKVDYRDDHMQMTVFPLSQWEAFENWLIKEDLRKGLHSPVDYDETSRVSSNKLKREAEQLPADRVGIIAIPLDARHFWCMHTDDTVDRFQNPLAPFPNVMGVYLFAEILHESDADINLGPLKRFTRTTIHDPLARYSIFIPNSSFAMQIPAQTLAKLTAIFR